MEQHPVARQITSFEFKLIGFMTLKQFLYLAIFIPVGFIAYKLFPIPILNILLGIAVCIFGAALAFLPINDRPLDVWIKNLIKRLSSPTQFFYKKNNPPLSIFSELYFVTDPHKVIAHIESQQKLASYLASRQKAVQAKSVSKVNIQNIIKTSGNIKTAVINNQNNKNFSQSVLQPASVQTVQSAPIQVQQGDRKPFFIGIVKNNKKIPLPGILIYVKDEKMEPVRLLKTNPHGVFATYNPLINGEYCFEIKDPKGIYFFDTIKLRVEQENLKPFEFQSKEML